MRRPAARCYDAAISLLAAKATPSFRTRCTHQHRGSVAGGAGGPTAVARVLRGPGVVLMCCAREVRRDTLAYSAGSPGRAKVGNGIRWRMRRSQLREPGHDQVPSWEGGRVSCHSRPGKQLTRLRVSGRDLSAGRPFSIFLFAGERLGAGPGLRLECRPENVGEAGRTSLANRAASSTRIRTERTCRRGFEDPWRGGPAWCLRGRTAQRDASPIRRIK